jgi:hypothetical protein
MSEEIDPGIVQRFLSFLENVEKAAMVDQGQRVCLLCSTMDLAWTAYSELKKITKITRCNEITLWMELRNGSTVAFHSQTDEVSVQRLMSSQFHELIIARDAGNDGEYRINPLNLIAAGVAEHVTVIH